MVGVLGSAGGRSGCRGGGTLGRSWSWFRRSIGSVGRLRSSRGTVDAVLVVVVVRVRKVSVVDERTRGYYCHVWLGAVRGTDTFETLAITAVSAAAAIPGLALLPAKVFGAVADGGDDTRNATVARV